MARSRSAKKKAPAPPPAVTPPTSAKDVSVEDIIRKHQREILISLTLGILILAGYRHVLENGFVNLDDIVYVTANPHVKEGLTGPNLTWAWTTSHAGNWHPLTWMSLQLDATLFGSEPLTAVGYHLTNLFLHVVNAILLFWVLRHLTKTIWPSALVAMLFAVHPLHVESVAWVAERKDVLSAFFWILSLGLYAWYIERPTWGRMFWVVLTMALGLLAKPMLVTLPFTLLLLDVWPLRRLNQGRKLLLEKLPLFVLSLAACIVTLRVQGQEGYVVASLEDLPLWVRLGNAILAYALYLGKTLWPLQLAVYYPHPGSNLVGWQVAVAAAVLVAVSVLVVKVRRDRPYFLVGWLWFLGTLVPVIGLVQVGEQAMADRYSYIPNIGLYLMIAWGLADLLAWRRWPVSVGIVGSVVVGGACLFLTSRQVSYWKNSATLWEHALAVTGSNARAHDALGDYYFRQGLTTDETKKAIEHFNKAVELGRKREDLHLRLGRAYLKLDRTEEAVQEFEKVIQLTPEEVDGHNNLGAARLRQEKLKEAQQSFERALELESTHVEARRNLGRVFFRQEKPKEAGEQYALAVESAKKAAKVTDTQKAFWLDVLAADQSEIDQFDEAERTARLAISYAEAAGQTVFAEAIQQRLQLYRNRKSPRAPGAASPESGFINPPRK